MTDESLFTIRNVKDLIDHFTFPADAKFIGIKITSFCDNTTPPIMKLFYVDKDNNDHEGVDLRTGCPYPPHCKQLFNNKEDISKCFQEQLQKFNMV